MVCLERGSCFFGPAAPHVRRIGNGAKKPLWVNQIGLNVPSVGFHLCGLTLSGRVECDEASVTKVHLKQNVRSKVLEIVHRMEWWVGFAVDP